MKKRKLKQNIKGAARTALSAEADLILSRNSARSSLIVAYVFTLSMAGLGLILSYLTLNILDLCTAEVTDLLGFIVVFILVYFFAAPAYASVRNTASAICDGREVTLPEIFLVFTSFKRWGSSYLPIRFFSWIPKYQKGQGKAYWSILRAALKARIQLIDALRFGIDLLLSVGTCFIYYILAMGPRSALRRELIIRRINNINLKNNERTVKRND